MQIQKKKKRGQIRYGVVYNIDYLESIIIGHSAELIGKNSRYNAYQDAGCRNGNTDDYPGF